MVTGPRVVELTQDYKVSQKAGCLPCPEQTSNPTLARKKADLCKINGDDDDSGDDDDDDEQNPQQQIK